MAKEDSPDSAERRAAATAAAGPRLALPATDRAFGLILENTSDLVALLDTRGVRLYNNPSYHALFGDRDLLGTDSFREIHPEDRERVREIFQDTVATGVGQRTRYRFIADDGSVRHIESQGNVVRDGTGRVAQVVVISRDITPRIEAEEALRESNRKLQATVLELEQRNRENAILGNLGDMVQLCKSVQEYNGVLAQYVGKLFPGTAGHFYLLNPANGLLESSVSWGDPLAAGDPVIGKDDCWSLRRSQLHAVDGPGAGLPCQHVGSVVRAPYFCAPITAQGEVLGMLHVQYGADETSPPDARENQAESRRVWAVTVSEHLSLALANLKLRETLRMQAVHDSLTGLYNRRYMEQALEREVLRATRSRRNVGLIMLDLDHFKTFNDTHGHEVGDLLLRSVGECLLANIRAEDIACRYGGEEFVVVLPEATLALTESRAQRLLKAIAGLGIRVRGELLGTVTASAGVAAYPEQGQSVAELLRAADAALYSAKGNGRNRAVTAGGT